MALRRHLKLDLFDVKSIEGAIRGLELYSAGLRSAAANTRFRLTEQVRDATDREYAAAAFDVRVPDADGNIDNSDIPHYQINVDHDLSGTTDVVWTDDEDAKFLEFGSGSRLNTGVGSSLHANPGPYVIGSYPSDTAEKNAARGYWHVPGGSGYAIGTPATGAMWISCEQARLDAQEVIEREVKQL